MNSLQRDLQPNNSNRPQSKLRGPLENIENTQTHYDDVQSNHHLFSELWDIPEVKTALFEP